MITLSGSEGIPSPRETCACNIDISIRESELLSSRKFFDIRDNNRPAPTLFRWKTSHCHFSKTLNVIEGTFTWVLDMDRKLVNIGLMIDYYLNALATCWSVIRSDMTPEDFHIMLTPRCKGKMANLKYEWRQEQRIDSIKPEGGGILRAAPRIFEIQHSLQTPSHHLRWGKEKILIDVERSIFLQVQISSCCTLMSMIWPIFQNH